MNGVIPDPYATSFTIVIQVKLRVTLHLTNSNIPHSIKAFQSIAHLLQIITPEHPSFLDSPLPITTIVTITTTVTTITISFTTTSTFIIKSTIRFVNHFS